MELEQQVVTRRNQARPGHCAASRLSRLRCTNLFMCFLCTLAGVVGFAYTFAGAIREFGGPLMRMNLLILMCNQIIITLAGILSLKGVSSNKTFPIKASLGLLVVCMIVSGYVALALYAKSLSAYTKLTVVIERRMKSYSFDLKESAVSSPEDRLLDEIQQNFTCCGSLSPYTWQNVNFKKIPHSCCYVSSDCIKVTRRYTNFQDAMDVLLRGVPDRLVFHQIGCVQAITTASKNRPPEDVEDIVLACAASSACFLFLIFIVLVVFHCALVRGNM